MHCYHHKLLHINLFFVFRLGVCSRSRPYQSLHIQNILCIIPTNSRMTATLQTAKGLSHSLDTDVITDGDETKTTVQRSDIFTTNLTASLGFLSVNIIADFYVSGGQ